MPGRSPARNRPSLDSRALHLDPRREALGFRHVLEHEDPLPLRSRLRLARHLKGAHPTLPLGCGDYFFPGGVVGAAGVAAFCVGGRPL